MSDKFCQTLPFECSVYIAISFSGGYSSGMADIQIIR